MPTTLLTQFLSDYGITQAPWILTIEVFCVVLLTFVTSFIANRFLISPLQAPAHNPYPLG